MTATGNRYWHAFGIRVGKARTASGMTQTDLGRRLGLSRASITAIEMGRQHVTAERVIDLARILRVDPAWLLRGDPAQDTRAPSTTDLLRARGLVERLLRAHADTFLRDADRLTQLATDLDRT